MATPLLQIQNLTVTVGDTDTPKILVDDASLAVENLSVTALVGGSGSGKTTTGLAVLRLLSPALSITGGKILLDGEDILNVTPERMRRIRGGAVSMVFQEPLSAFNPVFTIGDQVGEVLECHTKLNAAQRVKRVLELLDLVGLPEPRRVAGDYPHRLSGGMRQRAMIAQAIAADPKLIIADEPTSNLDVTLQARIMDLFQKLRKDLSLSILLITHDLGMVAHMADHVSVMTKGRIVENGTVGEVLERPQHAYTRELMEALA